MPALKNILHERFATSYPNGKLRGLSLGSIYLEAGGRAKNAHSADVLGSRLLARRDVQDRIAELRKPKEAVVIEDARDLYAKAQYLYDKSKDNPDTFPTASKAIEIQGRLLGAFLDRTQIDATLALPSLGTVDEVIDLIRREFGDEAAERLAGMDVNRKDKMVDVSPGSWRARQRRLYTQRRHEIDGDNEQ